MSKLFEPLTIRDVTFKNRVFVSPMCQYSAHDGVPTDWHLVHLGSRAVGGAGLVVVEATGVSAEGRISLGDTGLWNDEQARAFARIAKFVRDQGAVPGIQLAHAGRKASTEVPWQGGKPLTAAGGAWTTVGPSPIPFGEYPAPREATAADLDAIVDQFVSAARRAREAGFQVVELHMAHGYLLHSFLSPLSNRRTDGSGGPALEDRARFPLRVAAAVRAAWPANLPLFVRISSTDWVDGGWDLAQSIQFAKWLAVAGVDLVDCSSGGLVPDAKIPLYPGMQVQFAEAVRREAGVPTGAVGLITRPEQAEQIVASGQADAVFLARELLRNPYWPLEAARVLRDEAAWPKPYERAKLK